MQQPAIGGFRFEPAPGAQPAEPGVAEGDVADLVAQDDVERRRRFGIARLRQAVTTLTEKAQTNHVKLPENFFLGFEEFSAALPDKSLIAYPVDQSRIDLGGWWRHPRTTQLLHREYVKYLASLVTTRLAQ